MWRTAADSTAIGVSPRRARGVQRLLTVKRNFIVRSELCTDLETPRGRHINQDEKHTSRQDEAPRPRTGLDPVVGRCARPVAAALAWDTSAARGLGHFVSPVRLGAADASPCAAMASGRFGSLSATLAADRHAVFPARFQSNEYLCRLPIPREPITVDTPQVA